MDENMFLTDVLSFRTVGGGMVPRRQPGELVLCHKTREPADGDRVVVLLDEQENGGTPWSIGRVAREFEPNGAAAAPSRRRAIPLTAP